MNKNTTYNLRNVPYQNGGWHIAGTSVHIGSGVLEWCYDEADALYVLRQMQQDKRFSSLSIDQLPSPQPSL